MPPPALVDELVEEVLLRLPPAEPEWLVRASLVCKTWLRLLTNSRFSRRYGQSYRTPPLLGILHVTDGDYSWTSRFVPTTAFRPRSPDHPQWIAVDARHGRVLFFSYQERSSGFIIWDPITDARRRIPLPESRYISCNAAVLCAADGCDHLDCIGGPFLVAFVGIDTARLQYCCLYSSTTGAWSEKTFLEHPTVWVDTRPKVLVGNTVYFPSVQSSKIVEYNVSERTVSIIDPPLEYDQDLGTALVVTEDGVLGFVAVEQTMLRLWSRQVHPNGAVAWVLRGFVNINTLLPTRALYTLKVVGYAEGVGVIFVRTDAGLFTVELSSGRIRKVSSQKISGMVTPYMSFYTLDHARGIMPLP